MRSEEEEQLHSHSADMESGLMTDDGLRDYLDLGETEGGDTAPPVPDNIEDLRLKLTAFQAKNKSLEAKNHHLASQLLALKNEHGSGIKMALFAISDLIG